MYSQKTNIIVKDVTEKRTAKDKRRSKVKTFHVPFDLGDIKDNITLTTDYNSTMSKEQIINQAFRLHSQGDILGATKYYEKFCNEGYKDAEIFNNYGIILRERGELKRALNNVNKAIKLNPNFALAYSNVGSIYRDLGRLKEAENATLKAIKIDPNFAEGHLNLGYILNDLGRLTEAKSSTQNSLICNPNLMPAYASLSTILGDLGHKNDSIKCLKKAIRINPKSEIICFKLAQIYYLDAKYELAEKLLKEQISERCQSLYLGCLLGLNKTNDFYRQYNNIYKNNISNPEIGSIIDHANIINDNKLKSTFCNNSFDYIFVDKIDENNFSSTHLNQFISYLRSSNDKYKKQSLLMNGSQTSTELFGLDFPFIKSIKHSIEDKINKYKNNFIDFDDGLIENWPKSYSLKAWAVIMKPGGFLLPHNHTYGWISGSFYLKIPNLNRYTNEGSIAFTYKDPKFPSKEKNFPLSIKKVNTRDLIIFPSSLFHYTIPFKSKDERICFVFDLIPK